MKGPIQKIVNLRVLSAHQRRDNSLALLWLANKPTLLVPRNAVLMPTQIQSANSLAQKALWARVMANIHATEMMVFLREAILFVRLPRSVRNMCVLSVFCAKMQQP